MLSLLDSFGLNFDLTGVASDDEPGDALNRPLRGYRKRWRPPLSVAAESQSETLPPEPGGDLEGPGPYGPLEVFVFGKDACWVYVWIHVTTGLAAGAAELYEPSSPVKRQRMEMPKLLLERPLFNFVFVLARAGTVQSWLVAMICLLIQHLRVMMFRTCNFLLSEMQW